MDWSELQSLFAGRVLLPIVDQLGGRLPLLKDIQYIPTNDGFGVKFVRGIDTNVSYGIAGAVEVTAGGADVAGTTAVMYEVGGLATVPQSICGNNIAEKLDLYSNLKLRFLVRAGLAYMFGYKFANNAWSVEAVGFNSEANGEKIYCTEIDAEGTADAHGLTDVWIVRWDLDGAFVGFPFFQTTATDVPEASVLGLKLGNPYPDTINNQPVYAQPLWWQFAPASVRPTSVVKIKNLNHPLTGSGGKYLTEDLLLQAFGMLDDISGNISIIMATSQLTKFLQTLSSKTNLVTQIDQSNDAGLLQKVTVYNGGKIRTLLDIYHSKTQG